VRRFRYVPPIILRKMLDAEKSAKVIADLNAAKAEIEAKL
jgi:hypothetical protein